MTSDDELILRCKEALVYAAPELWLEKILTYQAQARNRDRFYREMAKYAAEYEVRL